MFLLGIHLGFKLSQKKQKSKENMYKQTVVDEYCINTKATKARQVDYFFLTH